MLSTHEIEDIVERFRDWLHETDEQLQATDLSALLEHITPEGDTSAVAGDAGFLQLIESFTALRHDLKLETKSLRALEAQREADRQTIDRAIHELHAAKTDANQAVDHAARPLLEALIDLDELLGRAVSTLDGAAGQSASDILNPLCQQLDSQFAQLTAWRRTTSHYWHQHVQKQLRALAAAQDAPGQTVAEGLRLVRLRLARALADAGLVRIECTGQQVDPHTMRVVDVCDDPNQAPETVVQEVRPGYRRGDRIMRFAEVIATRRTESMDRDGEQAFDDQL